MLHTWHWQTWNDRPYLTCSLLEGFDHGFFTRHFEGSPPAENVQALDPKAQVWRVKQVHGNGVLSPSEIEQRSPTPSDDPSCFPFPDGDGLVTEQPQQSVWVCSADCTPLLISDPRTGQVSAIHAGWRGTAAEILPRAIARLLQQGSQLQDLRIAMGPAIAGEVYQVSTTVAAQVGATILKSKEDPLAEVPDLPQVDPATVEPILVALKEIPDSPILDDPQPGRVRLDVRRVNLLQLERLGVQLDQVAIAPHCTYQTPEHFFSYRRDRQKKVQWSGIVSRTGATS